MPLRGVNFAQPGRYGLNTQQAIADDQTMQFASLARNGVIDRSGKLTSRKDFVLQTSSFTGVVHNVYTHRMDDGTELILSAAGGKIYSGTSTLTERYDSSQTAVNDWSFASLSGKIFIAQKGVSPKCLTESAFVDTAFTGAPWGNSPNIFLAADGRLWAADDETDDNRYTIWWSNLLDGTVWNSGDAGSLNVQKAWPKGQDSIIALAFLSGRLVVFGRDSILLYTLPADHNPASMSLTDVAENVGCIARDSVIVAGGDLYFLSKDGYYKIPRLAQVTSLIGLVKVSKNVADDFIDTYDTETLTSVRAGYNPKENILVLNAPTNNKTWCFHLDRLIPEMDIPAVTDWTNVGIPFRGFCYDKDGNWYCAMDNGIGKYTGYTPDGASNAYNFEFYTLWNQFGDETRLKHLKNWAMTLDADSGQTGTFRWQLDYKEGTTRTESFTCSAADFAEAPGIGVVKGSLGGSGNVARFGFSAAITGDQVTLHALRAYAKPGVTKAR